MRRGFDVRIDAQSNPGLDALAMRERVEKRKLRLRLAVECVNARVERVIDLVRSLANARKHDLRRIAARAYNSKQFAAGNDIKPRASSSEQLQNRKVPVRLHRIANCVRSLAESLIIGVVAVEDGFRGVHIARGPFFFRNFSKGHAFAIERAVTVFNWL